MRLDVVEAPGPWLSYELALLSLLGNSFPEEDTSTGESANGSGTGMRRITGLRDAPPERRESLGGLSTIETRSSKGSCASTAEPNAAAGVSSQTPVVCKGGSTGREGDRKDSSRVSRTCEKSRKTPGVRCFRRTHKKPITITIRTITVEMEAAIAATGTDLFGELEETGTTEGRFVWTVPVTGITMVLPDTCVKEDEVTPTLVVKKDDVSAATATLGEKASVEVGGLSAKLV